MIATINLVNICHLIWIQNFLTCANYCSAAGTKKIAAIIKCSILAIVRHFI